MSFKHFVRDSWLTASYYTGLSQLYQALRGRKRGIVCYHNVLPISTLPPFDTYNVDATAAVFDKQLAFLKKHFRVLPIQELDNSDKPGFFLTVDDGMRNNHEILAPILAQHDLTALFAVCPAMIDGELPHIWRDHLFLLFHQANDIKWLPDGITHSYTGVNALTRAIKKYVYQHQIADVYGLVREICEKNDWLYAPYTDDPLRYQFMDWDQVRDLHNLGHRIAAHTMTHRVLRFLSADEKRYELAESKKRIENQLNSAVDTLVYPYGSMAEIDQATVNMAEEVGYQTALMNVQQHSLQKPAFTHPRFAFPPIADSPHLHGIVSGYKFLFRVA
jgi:peptidoglycan/xylan/chitin deacetylase (PgdA/CDA1 family)